MRLPGPVSGDLLRRQPKAQRGDHPHGCFQAGAATLCQRPVEVLSAHTGSLGDVGHAPGPGEDAEGKVLGRHRSTGIARPRFWDRARYYGLERELAEALDSAE